MAADSRTGRAANAGEATASLGVFARAGAWLRSVVAASVAHPGDGTDRGLADVCRAVLALEALGQVTALPQAFRASCARSIDLLQDPATGIFSDRAGDPPDPSFPLSDVRATRLAAVALDALGRRPTYPLAFARSWAERTRAWPDAVEWGEPGGAEEVSLALSLLLHRAEVDADAAAPPRVHQALDALERAQDPLSGLWGGGQAPLGRRIEATFRVVSFLQYTHRPVRRVTRILDAVLAACPEEGGLGELLGDAHTALAAVSLLAGLPGAGHAAGAIERALLGGYAEMLALQADTGAFRGALEEGSRGDVLRTWLRVSALALIAQRHPGAVPPPVGWRAPRRPGPGYTPPAAVLTEHERQVAPLWLRPLPALDERLRAGGTPDVSVIVPCRDQGRYLHEALASVAAQSARAVEAVVVDDGSTDGFTLLLLEHWRARGLRIIAEENGGAAAARNRGANVAGGRYLCCLAAEDRLAPAFLERAAAVLDAQPEVGFVSGHVQLIDERDELLALDVGGVASVLAGNTVASAAVFRREAWERTGGFDVALERVAGVSGIEEWDFWLRLLEDGWQAHTLPQTAVERRVRPGRPRDADEPARWATAAAAFAARHGATCTEHAAALFTALHRRWAELRAAAAAAERSAAALRAQALTWRQRAESAEGTLRARESTDSAVERERSWWETHARDWRREAADTANALASQRDWIEELERARAWWQTQAAAWQAAAEERDRKIGELRSWIAELERRAAAAEEQAARWRPRRQGRFGSSAD